MNDWQARLDPIQAGDDVFMQMAIELAEQGVFLTRPNPSVGCVIAQDGRVVGKGRTDKAGGFHAEVFALRQAGDAARGATAYVTLEPCSHTGKTPPCCDALIKAGIRRVVACGVDPNPKVAGGGIRRLLEAGVLVSVGPMQDRAEAINRGFFKAMRKGLPYVRLKLATSLDGKIAMQSGESKWITNDLARQDVQRLRARSGAIITGSETILRDDPSLQARPIVDGCIDTKSGGIKIDVRDVPQPKIVAMDRRHRLRQSSPYRVFQQADTLLWRGDILPLLQTLARDFLCYDALVEAGATLASAFLLEGWVDELVLYQAPRLLGKSAQTMFVGDFERLQDCLRFATQSTELMGDNIKTVFYL